MVRALQTPIMRAKVFEQLAAISRKGVTMARHLENGLLHRGISWGMSGGRAPIVRCAVTLAGGDGRRLAPLVRRVRGDALPKQFVTFYGTQSLLERTFQRVERLVPPDRIFTVVTRNHLDYAEAGRQLTGRAKRTVVIQPENKDTAPGLLLPLMYLNKRYANAVVAVFPSDHFVADDRVFMGHVETAFQLVERHPALIVLLGVKPEVAETDYGYVVPGEPVTAEGRAEIRTVGRFVEKPAPRVARDLIQRGALWSTSVLVFRVQTMLEVMSRTAPLLPPVFSLIEEVIDTPREWEVIDAVYRNLPPVNLSRGVLEFIPDWCPSRLAVLRVEGVAWSDWGAERRVLSDLAKLDGPRRFREIDEVELLVRQSPNDC